MGIMKKCTKCGHKDTVDFCSNCGNELMKIGTRGEKIRKAKNLVLWIACFSFALIAIIGIAAAISLGLGLLGFIVAVGILVVILAIILTHHLIEGFAQMVDDVRDNKDYNKQMFEILSSKAKKQESE